MGLFPVVKFWSYIILTSTEAATGGVLLKKVLLKILQNSQENTCARVSFLIKLQAPPVILFKKQALT